MHSRFLVFVMVLFVLAGFVGAAPPKPKPKPNHPTLPYPTLSPTAYPTASPTASPTAAPTASPTVSPTPAVNTTGASTLSSSDTMSNINLFTSGSFVMLFGGLIALSVLLGVLAILVVYQKKENQATNGLRTLDYSVSSSSHPLTHSSAVDVDVEMEPTLTTRTPQVPL